MQSSKNSKIFKFLANRRVYQTCDQCIWHLKVKTSKARRMEKAAVSQKCGLSLCMSKNEGVLLLTQGLAASKLTTETNWKTGFIDFVVCLDNSIRVYNHMVTENGLLAYLPTSKISQDHLELLFAAVGSFGCCNDNSTANKFAAAYKCLIIHDEVKDIHGTNCLPLEHIEILFVSSSEKPSSIGVIKFTAPQRSPAVNEPLREAIFIRSWLLCRRRQGVWAWRCNCCAHSQVCS